MKKAVLTALLTLVLVACATSPTGRRQLMLVSPDEAIAASRTAYLQQMADFEEKGLLSKDQALIGRVQQITGRLVAQAVQMFPRTANWEWTVAVIDDPETVNAWAMAGGRMAIYTGLIEQLEATDDEIAQVMGHEIAHALANHTAEKMSVAMASQIGVLAVGISTEDTRAMAGAALAAALAVNLPFSRTAESESDRIGIELAARAGSGWARIGIELAARAGYRPEAAVTLWRKMAEVGGDGPPQFLSTHPSPSNRQQTLAELVPQMLPLYEAPGERPVYPVRSAAP